MSEQTPRGDVPLALDRDEVSELVAALHDDRPDGRVAVLDALLALPLARDVWFDVGDYVRWALRSSDVVPERTAVVARAGLVPLRSIRLTLVTIAEAGTDDVAAPAAARSLAAVGDGAALGPLVAELETLGLDGTDAPAQLTRLDVSDASAAVEAAFEKALANRDEAALPLALALARAGRDDSLRSFVVALDRGDTDLPPLFWGDPEVARAALAGGPLLTTSARAWLTRARDTASADAGRVAGVLLDADEGPVQRPPIADVDPERVPSPAELAAARPVADALLEPDGRPRDGWDAQLAAGPAERTALVSALVTRLLERAPDVFAGNAAVQVADAHASDFVPDVRALAALPADAPGAEQAAWAASRGGARLLVAELAGGLADPARREETARFLARAGRHLRSAGPLFLGGAPAEEAAAPPELIDDMFMTAAEPPSEAEPVGAEAPDEAGTPLPPSDAMPSPPTIPPPPPPPAASASGRPSRPRLPRLRRPRRPRATEKPPDRVLQAEVADATDAAAPVALRRGFRRGAWHRLTVSIGPEKTTALPGEGPTFEEVFGEQQADLLLDFVFNATGAVPPDQALQLKDKVRLPVGRSAEVSFDFQLLPALDEVRIQLEVRMGQRVIQPAVLTGPAADDPATLPSGSAIRLFRGTPLALPSSAAVRDPLDGVVSVGGTRADGAPLATVARSGEISFFDTTGLRDAVHGLELLLDSIVTDDRATPESLADDQAQAGLFKLALRGAQLYDAVGAEIVRTLGGAAERIQLLLRDDSVVMPLELVYDLGAPARGAILCSNWKKALSSGACDQSFHPSADDGNAAVVCPSGFWAVTKTIERQVAPESLFSEAASSFDVAARTEMAGPGDPLPVLKGAVLAASDRVAGADVERLARVIGDRVGRSATAATWSGWRRGVKRTHASLLVLLSHTVRDDTGWALQIGEAENLYVAQVNAAYVSTADPPRLIALLLGCETVENPEELQSFVARFRAGGASLVVGTVCGVLGDRAPGVAEELVRRFATAAGRTRPQTAGAVIQDARRALLARGELTALALAAYGDIDWRITHD